MGLYNHVDDRNDLLRGIAERLLDAAQFEGASGDWREKVTHCFDALRSVCLRHPGAARLMQMAGIAPNRILVTMEITACVVRCGPRSHRRAPRLFRPRELYPLARFLTRSTVLLRIWILASPSQDSPRALLSLLSGRYSLTDHGGFDKAFAFGLTIILDGLEKAADRSR